MSARGTYIIAVRVQVDAESIEQAEMRADELVPYLQTETAGLYSLPEGITSAYVDDVRTIDD